MPTSWHLARSQRIFSSTSWFFKPTSFIIVPTNHPLPFQHVRTDLLMSVTLLRFSSWKGDCQKSNPLVEMDVRSYPCMPWPLWSLPHPQRCKWMSSKRSWATRKSNSSWSRVSYGRYNSLYILLHNAKLSSIFFHSNLRKLNESDWPPSTTPLVLSQRALRQSYKTCW